MNPCRPIKMHLCHWSPLWRKRLSIWRSESKKGQQRGPQHPGLSKEVGLSVLPLPIIFLVQLCKTLLFHFGLVLFCCLFVVMGGGIFYWLERPPEDETILEAKQLLDIESNGLLNSLENQLQYKGADIWKGPAEWWEDAMRAHGLIKKTHRDLFQVIWMKPFSKMQCCGGWMITRGQHNWLIL